MAKVRRYNGLIYYIINIVSGIPVLYEFGVVVVVILMEKYSSNNCEECCRVDS